MLYELFLLDIPDTTSPCVIAAWDRRGGVVHPRQEPPLWVEVLQET